MKAISIKQPWASLIVEGLKDIEDRTWKCPEKYIGKRVMIHASQKPLRPVKLFNSMQKDVIKRAGLWETCVFPECGSIIGSVEIVDCVINHPSIWAEKSETNCSEKCRSKNCEHFIEWGFRGGIVNVDLVNL